MTVGWIAWSLWGAFVVTLAAATYFGFNPPSGPPIQLLDAIWAASFIGFPTTGALIVSRMPRRPLGWILLIAPLLTMIGVALDDATRALEGSDAGAWVGWLASVCFAAGLGSLVLVPLYLPNGELPSPRWGWTGSIAWGAAGLTVMHAAFKPGPIETVSDPLRNPLGIEPLKPVFDLIEAGLGPAFLLIVAVGVLSLIVRFRSSTGVERQQMKWLAVGGVGVLAPFGAMAAIEAVLGDLEGEVPATLLLVVAILSLPTAIAVAVLKTRLYAVDFVINKTLVYVVLTTLLAGLYLISIVLLQGVLPVTEGSDLAVAGSTLGVAALFRPLRTRVQAFIDRRFYRRKYDAAQTLGGFSARLRDQVDLDALGRDLVSVVGTTMQPVHASLWLRETRV